MSENTINLEEFLAGYKTYTLQRKDKVRKFREPKIPEIASKSPDQLFVSLCIEGDFAELSKLIDEEATPSQRDALVMEVFKGLGLVS